MKDEYPSPGKKPKAFRISDDVPDKIDNDPLRYLADAKDWLLRGNLESAQKASEAAAMRIFALRKELIEELK